MVLVEAAQFASEAPPLPICLGCDGTIRFNGSNALSLPSRRETAPHFDDIVSDVFFDIRFVCLE